MKCNSRVLIRFLLVYFYFPDNEKKNKLAKAKIAEGKLTLLNKIKKYIYSYIDNTLVNFHHDTCSKKLKIIMIFQ